MMKLLKSKIVTLGLASAFFFGANLIVYTEHSDASENSVKKASQAGFEHDVLSAKGPVLVEFYASWCGPCKQMAPIVEELSKSYSGKVTFAKVDVDENPELSMKYNIQAIPAIKIFKDGKVVEENLGLTSPQQLSAKINQVL